MKKKAKKATRRKASVSRIEWVPRLLIRQLREAAGLKAVDAAKALGLDPCRLYEYESGRRMPSWGMLLHIAQTLGARTIGEIIDSESRFDTCYKQYFQKDEPTET